MSIASWRGGGGGGGSEEMMAFNLFSSVQLENDIFWFFNLFSLVTTSTTIHCPLSEE
jgi:hypothetical protein